jgi:hypothetical protein
MKNILIIVLAGLLLGTSLSLIDSNKKSETQFKHIMSQQQTIKSLNHQLFEIEMEGNK